MKGLAFHMASSNKQVHIMKVIFILKMKGDVEISEIKQALEQDWDGTLATKLCCYVEVVF